MLTFLVTDTKLQSHFEALAVQKRFSEPVSGYLKSQILLGRRGGEICHLVFTHYNLRYIHFLSAATIENLYVARG